MTTTAQDLLAENRLLRRQMEDFLSRARDNEHKLRRFQALELRLIGINALDALMESLLYPDYSTFKWDMVTLILLDPEYEIQRLLEEKNHTLLTHPALMFATDRGALESLYPRSLFPMLGPYRARQHATLFPGRQRPASVALLPLVRQGRLIGSLNLGSLAGHRFVSGVRTDFFEHLGAVVAICLENAVNHERLKRQGLTDTLTAVNNRRFFDQRLAEEVAAARRDDHALACLLLDVDHFKQVNDRHGHQTGDRVLMEVAALIRTQLRGHDVLARYGGEEFAALLAQTTEEGALEVAERIRASIAARQFRALDGTAFQVTISIGCAVFEPAAPVDAPAEALVSLADRALYRAKAEGRDRVVSGGCLARSLSK